MAKTAYAPPKTIGETPVYWDREHRPVESHGHLCIDVFPDYGDNWEDIPEDDDRVWFFCLRHGEIFAAHI